MTHRMILGCMAVMVLQQACGLEPKKVRVVDQVNAQGAYSTRDVTLSTITDFASATGGAATFFGGASIRMPTEIDSTQGALYDRGAKTDELVTGEGTVHVEWILDGDVAVPTDFDSLAILSAYAHLEEAALAFRAMGVSIAQQPASVYYHGSIEDAGLLNLPTTDNAAYTSLVDGFLLLQMDALQDIPFSMNRGVLAHEYAHRVFYFEAWAGRMIELLGSKPQSPGAFNLIKAVDEGLSDYFGARITGNTKFLSASVAGNEASERDVSETRIVADAAWALGMSPVVPGQENVYNPYAMGAVLASMLWEFTLITDGTTTDTAVIDAERSLSVILQRGDSYTAGIFENEVIGHMPPSVLTRLCSRAQYAYAGAGIAFGKCP